MKKSKLGYKRNSPDVKKPYNVIPSGRITMKDVDFPVFGIDDMGNEQMMYPGGEYQFPGSQVFEIPMAQFGMSKRKVDRILNENKDLNWVKRLYESNAPSITLPGESKPSTHFMESADGKVYPTVVQMSDGSLQYLGDDAYDYAVQTGEYIQFKNDRQARRFGKDYKKGTGVLQGFQKGGGQQKSTEKEAPSKFDESIRQKLVGKANDIISSGDYYRLSPQKARIVKENNGNPNELTCIGGVCRVLKDVGVIDNTIESNTEFTEKASGLGFSKPSFNMNALKPGDVIQHFGKVNKSGKGYPTHAQMYLGKDESGEHVFFDNYRGTSQWYGKTGKKSYSEKQLQEFLKKGQSGSSGGAQLIHINPNANIDYETPEEKQIRESKESSRSKRLPVETYKDQLYSDSKYFDEIVNTQDLPYAYSYSKDASNNEKQLIGLFNNSELDKKLRENFKVSDQTLEKLKPLIYGVIKQESNFGNPETLGRSLKYGIENLIGNSSWSTGPAAVRYGSLRDNAQNLLNNDPDSLQTIEGAYIAALDSLLSSGNISDAYVSNNPELADKDPWAAALYFYNGQGRSLKKGETKSGEPLRVDEGSYPYKVLENAKNLKRFIPFDADLSNPDVYQDPFDVVVKPFQYGGQGKAPAFPAPGLNPTLAKYLQKPENIEEAKERIISDAKGVTLESKVNRALGNPKRRAAGLSEAVADLSEGPIDNIRHTAAGMYTSNAIAEYLNPDDNVLLTVPAKAAGFIGSNLGGIAHEIKAFVPSLEGDYTNVLPAARMTLEDTFNNFVGSALSVNPFMSEKEKEDLIINLSNSNLLPDGYEQMSSSQAENMYVKEFGGDLEEFGSGGLKQWFAEKWVDVKTGEECGRSGKDKNGRPYPACRPSKRVNSTTPKTTSEMSSSEKAKFKSVKNSGKRISYNHTRKQEGGQMPTMDNVEGMFDYWMNNYNTSGLLKDKSREEALDEFKKIYLKAATRN
jgi:hypothetical protein